MASRALSDPAVRVAIQTLCVWLFTIKNQSDKSDEFKKGKKEEEEEEEEEEKEDPFRCCPVHTTSRVWLQPWGRRCAPRGANTTRAAGGRAVTLHTARESWHGRCGKGGYPSQPPSCM